jgi:hypothetical protein
MVTSDQLHALASLPQAHTVWEVTHSWSDHYGEKTSLAPARNQIPDIPPSSLVTTVTIMHLWLLDVFKPFRTLEVPVL